MDKESLKRIVGFYSNYAHMLVKDLDDQQMVTLPAGMKNHPMWTYGHLADSNYWIGKHLGLDNPLDESWSQIFGMKATRHTQPGDYPMNKDTIVESLTTSNNNLLAAYLQADGDKLAEPSPVQELANVAPTLGDLTVFLLDTHQAIHLGQISGWRQAMGLTNVLG